jgi:hypothetical protein
MFQVPDLLKLAPDLPSTLLHLVRDIALFAKKSDTAATSAR